MLLAGEITAIRKVSESEILTLYVCNRLKFRVGFNDIAQGRSAQGGLSEGQREDVARLTCQHPSHQIPEPRKFSPTRDFN